MQIIDHELADYPVLVDRFNDTTATLGATPIILLGFPIRNRYDQTRLQLNPEMLPVDIAHPTPDEPTGVMYLRGIKLTPKSRMVPLLEQVQQYTKYTSVTRKSIAITAYAQLLFQYELTCKESYRHLRACVYPVDSRHVNILTTSTINIADYYNTLFQYTADVPNWQRLSGLSLFMLTSDTTKLEKIA